MENLEIPSSAARLGVKSMGLDGRMRDYARAIEKWLYMGERKKGLGRMIEEVRNQVFTFYFLFIVCRY